MSGITVKPTPLLTTPPTVTTTFPVVAAGGTVTPMLVALQELAVPADTPLNVTVLVPCVAPKLVPVIATGVPTAPDVGFKLVMLTDCVIALAVLEYPLRLPAASVARTRYV